MTLTKKRVADVLVDTLVAAGVKNVYGLVGDSLNGITDSIRARKNLKWVPVKHEETAAFAAGAEAHLTGRLAVCAGSCGPGNLHLIHGLFEGLAPRLGCQVQFFTGRKANMSPARKPEPVLHSGGKNSGRAPLSIGGMAGRSPGAEGAYSYWAMQNLPNGQWPPERAMSRLGV
jgi:hypothetical protein